VWSSVPNFTWIGTYVSLLRARHLNFDRFGIFGLSYPPSLLIMVTFDTWEWIYGMLFSTQFPLDWLIILLQRGDKPQISQIFKFSIRKWRHLAVPKQSWMCCTTTSFSLSINIKIALKFKWLNDYTMFTNLLFKSMMDKQKPQKSLTFWPLAAYNVQAPP